MQQKKDDAIEDFNWLIGAIDSYVKDDTYQYAIALEGDWGSGKTRFLEKEIKPLIKNQKKTFLRVSMFGVSNAAELYERIVNAIMHVDTKGKSRVKTVAKGAAGKTAELATGVMDKLGIPLSFDIKAESLVNLLVSKKHVIVFDDTERLADGADSMGLFGAINDLVENKGTKAIIVANSFASKDEGGQFEETVKEKLIWHTYHFNPDPAYLVKAIYSEIKGELSGRSYLDIACEAAVLANCRNARALIRSHAFVRDLCGISALSDAAIASSSRLSALKDGIRFALLCCMGEEPKSPEKLESTGEGLTADFFQNVLQKELYEKFRDFSYIGQFFNPKEDGSLVDLDTSFRNYIEKRYPDSEGTTVIRNTLEQLSSVLDMTDEMVIPIIHSFFDAIKKGDFSIFVARDALMVHRDFGILGFDMPLSDEEFVDSFKRVIRNDPSKAFSVFHDLDIFFGLTEGCIERGMAEELKDYAEQLYVEQLSALFSGGADRNAVLSKQLELACKQDISLLPKINPDRIAQAFSFSEPVEQNAISRFFFQLKSFFIPNGEMTEPFVVWVEELQKNVSLLAPESHTDKIRRKHFLDNLKALRAHLRPGEASN